jgi:hypothetical protein
MMGYLLDLLEYWVLPNTETQFESGCDILRILTKWCQSPDGFMWLRTQFALCEDQWACTGVGIVVRLWNKVMTSNDSNMILAVECIRLLHLVLNHLQRERSESSPSCSFRSLVSEYPELYRSASHMTLANENVSPDIQRLVAIQLEEIAYDEEELEELRQAVALAAT